MSVAKRILSFHFGTFRRPPPPKGAPDVLLSMLRMAQAVAIGLVLAAPVFLDWYLR